MLHSMVHTRGSVFKFVQFAPESCFQIFNSNIYIFRSLPVLEIPVGLNTANHVQACPDFARKLFESCSLECQKVAKENCQESQKMLPKFLDIFI